MCAILLHLVVPGTPHTNDSLYLTCAGGSLSDYLVRNKMDEEVARYFFKQLLAAIRYW
jgi:serine/threonine protein kinase